MEITYDTSHERVDTEQLAVLMRAVGWQDRAQDLGRLKATVLGSLWIVSAWEGMKLVGFCRAFSDGIRSAHVSDVAVLPNISGRASGER